MKIEGEFGSHCVSLFSKKREELYQEENLSYDEKTLILKLIIDECNKFVSNIQLTRYILKYHKSNIWPTQSIQLWPEKAGPDRYSVVMRYMFEKNL